jgi:hypothetical protein
VPKRSTAQVGREFVRHVLPGVLRPMRTLWNEIIGFLFIVLALWATPSGIRAVREFEGDPRDLFRLGLVGGFILMMSWFGISSFRRARRISRS